MVNKELLRKIADRIEKTPEGYNQRRYCGTACCVAGWALKISSPKAYLGLEAEFLNGDGDYGSIADPAAELLGLKGRPPLLFEESWPEGWFVRAGVPPGIKEFPGFFIPEPEHAVAILRKAAEDEEEWINE